jgi:Beta-propeller repeat
MGSIEPGAVGTDYGDVYLQKYAPDGQLLWARQFGTLYSDSMPRMAVDALGGVTIGWMVDHLDGVVWETGLRRYAKNGDVAYARLHAPGPGSVFLGGLASGGGDITYVVATSTDGPQGTPATRATSLNGRGEQYSSWLIPPLQDSGGGPIAWANSLYLATVTSGALPGYSNAGGEDVLVRRFDYLGTEFSSWQFGSSDNDRPVALSSEYGSLWLLALVGAAVGDQAAQGGLDAYVRRMTPDGVELWSRQLGTSGNDWPYGLCQDALGNAYVVGATDGVMPGQRSSGGGDAFFLKLPP